MEGSGAFLDIQSSTFVATELTNVIEHFICRLCGLVVFQPKECPKCNSVYCHECVQADLGKKGGRWKCQECQSADAVIDIHRVVKEVLEKLVFQCPKCNSVKRTYNEMNAHMKACDGVKSSSQNTAEIAAQVGTPVGPASSSLVSGGSSAMVQPVAIPDLMIYIMEKDSKRFFLYNTRTQVVTSNTVQTQTNFPHNFQAIQVGILNTRVYIVGGGDFNQLPDTMFQMSQIVAIPGSPGQFRLENKAKMQYARHGHSCCSIGENHIIVTGSRKDIDGACKQTELYNAATDRWMTLSPLNTGRHYHSSCSFQNKSVYVFCGISNESKKYLNTIEKLDIDMSSPLTKKWQILQIPNQAIFTARQGCGVCEVQTQGSNEILIVGGFHGAFSNETFFLNTSTNNLRKAFSELKDNIFPFQVPTIADPANRSVITVDWQTYKVYEFKNDQWQFKKKLKQ